METLLSGIVCIDIGGTYIKSGFLQNGELWDVKEVPTPPKGGNEIIKVIVEIVKGYEHVVGVGISTAGEVNVQEGSILYAVNIPNYTGLQLKKILEIELQVPVAVENDVNAAAVGELYFGAGKKYNLTSFMMASYGTGTGGAIILEGKLYRGYSGSAGEIGGLITHPEAVIGEEGSGTYEKYASTKALVQRASRLSPDLNTGRAIFNEIEDKTVSTVVNRWIDEVSYGLIGAIHLLNPQALVLGGGIMQQESILPLLQIEVRKMLKPTFSKTEIVCATLGNNASLYGAGCLVAELC